MNRAKFFCAVVLVLLQQAANAADNAIPIWQGVAPGSDGWAQQEQALHFADQQVVRNVVTPTITAYWPAPGTANGTAVLICPGGGFLFLSMETEGVDVAKWLNDRGIAAFVLKYRLTNTGSNNVEFRYNVAKFFLKTWFDSKFANQDVKSRALPIAEVQPLAIADGLQALQVIRAHAPQWGLKPHRIGVIGFSAGAAVANGIATQFNPSNRPDFSASIYGTSVPIEAIPKDAPPLFIIAAENDPIVPPASSVDLRNAWRAGGHSAEMYLYEEGGHGFGMKRQGLPVDHWIDRYGAWLGSLGLLSVKSPQG